MAQNNQSSKTDYQKIYLVLWIIAITLVDFVLFLIGPLVTFIICLRIRNSRLSFYLKRIVIALFILQCCLIGMAIPGFLKALLKIKVVKVKTNTSIILTALERYAADNGTYPQYISRLLTDGYLAEFPANPFTKEPMKNISVDDPDFEGNFAYLPDVLDDKSGFVPGYYLISYGSPKMPEMNINYDGVPDNIIQVTSEGCTLFHIYQRWNPGNIVNNDIEEKIMRTYGKFYHSEPHRVSTFEELLKKAKSDKKS